MSPIFGPNYEWSANMYSSDCWNEYGNMTTINAKGSAKQKQTPIGKQFFMIYLNVKILRGSVSQGFPVSGPHSWDNYGTLLVFQHNFQYILFSGFKEYWFDYLLQNT